MLNFVVVCVMIADWNGTILFCSDQMSERSSVRKARGQNGEYMYVSQTPESL